MRDLSGEEWEAGRKQFQAKDQIRGLGKHEIRHEVIGVY